MAYNSENYCVMSDLIGKTVTGLFVSSDQSRLVVTHDEFASAYECYGDCCSETWIADIVGVSALIGHKVLSAEDVTMEDVDDGRSRQEYDCFYGIKLVTTGGIVDIVYRNSSNGYYGGSLDRDSSWKYLDLAEMIAVTEDYSA